MSACQMAGACCTNRGSTAVGKQSQQQRRLEGCLDIEASLGSWGPAQITSANADMWHASINNEHAGQGAQCLPAAQGELKQRPVSAAINVRLIIWDTIVEHEIQDSDQIQQAGSGL